MSKTCMLSLALGVVFALVYFDLCQTCDFETADCHHWRRSGFTIINEKDFNQDNMLKGVGMKGSIRGHFAILSGNEHKNVGFLTSDWYPADFRNYSLTFYSVFNCTWSNCSLTVNIRTKSSVDVILKLSSEEETNIWKRQNIWIGIQAQAFVVELVGYVGDENVYFGIDDVIVYTSENNIGEKKACYLSDIEYRDISCVSKCYCADKIQECGNLEDLSTCTFEDGLCGWHNNIDEDDFNWTLHQGKTNTLYTGPSNDHTIGDATGHYVYIEATGADMHHRAILESDMLPPLPSQVLDPESPYYKTCKIQFYYHMYGLYTSELRLDMIENVCDGKSDYFELISRYNENIDKWQYLEIPILGTTHSYRLRFVGYRGEKASGDIAIDDVSLTKECFGIGLPTNRSLQVFNEETWNDQHTTEAIDDVDNTSNGNYSTHTDLLNQTTGYLVSRNSTIVFNFDPCGAIGREGPSESSCKSQYRNGNIADIKVISEGNLKGVQVWTVPQDGTYLISAFGAEGGKGARPVGKSSKGGSAEGKFNLTEGEELYILVGQKGQDACHASSISFNVKKMCDESLSAVFTASNNDTVFAGGGGGGGGGASFVAKRDPKLKILIPLVIAGGGGGLSYIGSSDISVGHGGFTVLGPGVSGHTNPSGAGGGGGWNGTTDFIQAGRSFLEGGGVGGESCPKSYWNTPGGFGGGGGACSSGGGGGGYTGGNASDTDRHDGVGEGGSSYVHHDAFDEKYYPNIQRGHGFVEIQIDFQCPCQWICKIYNWKKRNYTCNCPGGQILSADRHTCIEVFHSNTTTSKVTANKTTAQTQEGLELGYIVAIAVSVTIMLIAAGGVFICIVQQHKKKKYLKSVRMELASTNQTIRTTTTNGNLPIVSVRTNRMMEYNPNYDFVGAKYPEQQLTEINRNKLRLVRALGQGAFGDVYKGYLAGVPHVTGELPVAIKTLPAYTTEQAETDFLMEAVIMSKFSHPNIVKFLGVCFEDHPRYIILELLEGGDLKTFLREIRPKADNDPCVLCVADLLKLAVDVAKGCQHLEEKHFIHRDIAARNCLLTCKGPKRIAKIADFGMSRDIYRTDYYKKGGKALLPIKWMPPEAFLDGVFTSKTDVWSYGIMLWEIFSMGYMPYPGITNHVVMHYVTTGGRLEAPDKCPSAVYQLMSICWAAIPETRPTFSEILQQLERCLQNPEVLNAQLPASCRIMNMDKDMMSALPQDSNTQDLISMLPIVQEEEDICNIHDSDSGDPLLAGIEEENNLKGNGVGKDIDKLDLPTLFVQLTPESLSKCSSERNSPSLCNQTLSTSSSSSSPLIQTSILHADVSTQFCSTINSSSNTRPLKGNNVSTTNMSYQPDSFSLSSVHMKNEDS